MLLPQPNRKDVKDLPPREVLEVLLKCGFGELSTVEPCRLTLANERPCENDGR